MREAFSSLGAHDLLLIAFLLAVLLGMTLYQAFGEGYDRLTNARMCVLDAVRMMAAEEQRVVEHVHHVLLSEALLPELRREVAIGGYAISHTTGRPA